MSNRGFFPEAVINAKPNGDDLANKPSILEMISGGISAFVGSGINSGGTHGNSLLNGFDLGQISRIIQTLQVLSNSSSLNNRDSSTLY